MYSSTQYGLYLVSLYNVSTSLFFIQLFSMLWSPASAQLNLFITPFMSHNSNTVTLNSNSQTVNWLKNYVFIEIEITAEPYKTILQYNADFIYFSPFNMWL